MGSDQLDRVNTCRHKETGEKAPELRSEGF
jgi:hypothetical protein